MTMAREYLALTTAMQTTTNYKDKKYQQVRWSTANKMDCQLRC